MPTTKTLNINTNEPVLVTGATGYVAGVLIDKLLSQGVTVHATVRDPSKTERLQYLQELAKSHNSTIKFFAGDLLTPSSFDEAAKGCSIIFHTASPFAMSVEDPDRDLIDPAVKGTENVLTTASKTPTVKRVVLTSSVVAIYSNAIDQFDLPNRVFDESVWNRTSTRTENPYNLSKTMAEQRAWVMAGSQTQYKLVVINPGFVLGPGLKYHGTSESYTVMKSMGAGGDLQYGAPDLPMAVVDVRDVADAHIAAAYLPDAAGRHVLGANTSFPAMGQLLATNFPGHGVCSGKLFLPKFLLWLLAPLVGMTRSYVSKNIGYTVNFDATKAKSELGMNFLSLETTMVDMYQQLLDLGVCQGPKDKSA